MLNLVLKKKANKKTQQQQTLICKDPYSIFRHFEIIGVNSGVSIHLPVPKKILSRRSNDFSAEIVSDRSSSLM